MRQNILGLLFCVGVCSCSNEKIIEKVGKPMVFNDPSLIVTETDSAKLINTVNDITPKNKFSKAKQISTLVAAVDSVAVVKEINKQSEVAQPVTSVATLGTQINGEGYNITSDLPLVDDGKKYRLKEGKYIDDFKIAVTNLSDVKVSQVFFTKLSYQFNGKDYLLEELHEYKNPEISLTETNKVFQGLATNQAIFKNTDSRSLTLASDRALRADKMDRKGLEASIASLKSIKNYTNAACKPVITGFNIKISGSLNGKPITKTISVSL